MAVNWGIKQFKAAFFDRAEIIRKLEVGQRKALIRVGGFIRTVAKRSIRQRKAISPPGQPPSSHTGVLRDLIFFAYDPDSKSVVIGPAKSNQRNAFGISSNGGGATVPGVLEFGGVVGLHEVFLRDGRGGRWVRINFKARQGSYRSALTATGKPRPTRVREAKHPARPFITPAGQMGVTKFRELLRNMVT